MAVVTATKGSFSVNAYIGDSKTLLAFNFASAADAKNLAGFNDDLRHCILCIDLHPGNGR